MYFICDLPGAPCQCSVLINRVGSPERPGLSPILFQQNQGSVQSRRKVFRLQEHCLEVSPCVCRSTNQQTQNTASILSSHCAHGCMNKSISSTLSLSHNYAFQKLRGKIKYPVLHMHTGSENEIYHCKHKRLHTQGHIVTHSHTCAQTLQPFKQLPLLRSFI